DVNKRKTSVRIGSSTLKRGKNPVVKVVASESGTVRIQVKQGSRTVTRYATVKADRTKKVTLPKLSKKGSTNGRVTVTFTPAAGETYAASVATKVVKIRR